MEQINFRDLKEKKDPILKDIDIVDSCEAEGTLTSELSTLRHAKKIELEELLLREKMLWRQKARIKWVKEGDYNSKYFNRVATRKRKKKFIKSLMSIVARLED